MKLTGSYEIKLNKEAVWKALNDPEILKKSIPGCEDFKKNSETHFSTTATNKIGPFNATFTGDIELKDLNPPDSYTIFGEGNSPVGFATGEANVKLIQKDNRITILEYTVNVSVGGKIAQIGSRLIDMTAKKMADIFFKNFSKSIVPNEMKDVKVDVEIKEEEKADIFFKKKYIYLLLVIIVLSILVFN